MQLAPGTQLGAYEIRALHGAGGMGEVYRARDTRLDREVALKVLPASIALQPDRLQRFEREAKAVASLNHPNIVTLHSIEEVEGIRFLTMEMVSGQSLDQLVTPGGLPLARVLALGIPLADALVAAHQKGVIHRDLKPANLMVTEEGRLKVLDFGLAKLATGGPVPDASQAPTEVAPVSMAGQVVGTVPYMAPEQLRGDVVDARTDLFSLGVLLYELATGRRPFGGASPADVSSAILRDAPAPLGSVRIDLPADFERIIGRCLEKDPEQRFQTAMDVRTELERVQRAMEAVPWDVAGGRGAILSSAPRAAGPIAPEVPSIAVLPFANRGRDAEDEYFAEGLADELLNMLARIRGLRVAARTSSHAFKDGSADLATIGRKLNVTTLLEGSVRKAGNRVRLAVQLVNVADGFHLWSQSYDRTLDDIFAVQDDIAQSVVKELRFTLLGEQPDSTATVGVKAEVAAAAIGRGTDAESHRLFLQGRYFVNRHSGPDLLRGIEHLRRAVEADPEHALAWACLSWGITTATGLGDVDVDQGIAEARQAAARALELAPDLAEAHLALGTIQVFHDFDWNRAEASLTRALELAPGNAEVLRSAGMLAFHLGRFDEALPLCRRAIEQDPLSVTCYTYLGRVERGAGQFAAAEASLRQGLEISSSATAAHMALALVLDAQGRREEALAEAMQEPAESTRLYALALIHHTGGRRAESDAAFRELTERHATTAAFQVAVVSAVRGEVDAAFEWLDRALAQRDSGIAFSGVEALLRPLHGDPRWAPWLRRIGLRT